MELKSGTILRNGTYRILHKSCQDEFGITYLAIDSRFHKTVVITEFFPLRFCKRGCDGLSVCPETPPCGDIVDSLKTCFLTEVSNLAALSHPNIVRVLDLFKENGTAYYVIDYVPGVSLEQYVRANGPMPPHLAVRFIRYVTGAVEYLHARGMIHGGLSPANIILSENYNTPVLVNFDFSNHYHNIITGGSTSCRRFINGPYADFEACVSPASPASDIYSLGATFYFLLTGSAPSSVPELFYYRMPFPPGVPMQYRDVIAKAMSPLAKGRYQSVCELQADLDSTASSVPPGAPPGNPGNNHTRIIHTARKRGNNRALMAIVMVVVALAIGFGAYFIVHDRLATPRHESAETTATADTLQTPENAAAADAPEATAVQEEQRRTEEDKTKQAEIAKEKEHSFNSKLPMTFSGTIYDSSGNDFEATVRLKANGSCVLELNVQGDYTYYGTFSKSGDNLTFHFTKWKTWNDEKMKEETERLPSYESNMRSRSGSISEDCRSLTINLPEYGRCRLRR